MGLRKPFSSLAIHSASREDREQRVGHVPGSGSGEQPHAESQKLHAEANNEALAKRIEALRTLLAEALASDWVTVADPPAPTELDLPAELRAGPPPDHEQFQLARPHLLSDLLPRIGGGKHDTGGPSERAYHEAMKVWDAARRQEDEALARVTREHQAESDAREKRRASAAAGDPAAIRTEVETALANSTVTSRPHPDVSVIVDGTTRVLNIGLRLPTMDEIVPRVDRYRYARRRDEIVSQPCPPEKRLGLYRSVVAQLALLALHAAFTASPAAWIDAVALDVFAVGIDPATGRTTRSTLARARVGRATFAALDLRRVDPVACLDRLSGDPPGGLKTTADD